MTTLLSILEFLWNSDIARLIGGALAALLAFWGYGAAKERQGKLAAQKQAEIDKLKADAKARDKSNEALREERRAGGDNAAVVERLHDRDDKWK